MVTNDKRIIEMREKIRIKKEELESIAKVEYKTHLSLNLVGERYNLNVASEDILLRVLLNLNMINNAVKSDELLQREYRIEGYTVEDWIYDVKAKYELKKVRAKKSELIALENKLVNMLSDDKKTELELDSIEDMIK
jgi:hypothetical protein